MIEFKMTPSQFEKKRAELKAEQGIELVGSAGTIEKHGVRASWTYDGVNLEVVILDHPFFISRDHCEEHLIAWLAGT